MAVMPSGAVYQSSWPPGMAHNYCARQLFIVLIANRPSGELL
jgi:hypothetical protein